MWLRWLPCWPSGLAKRPSSTTRRIIFLSSKERELTADGQRALGDFVLPSYLELLNAIARELNQPDLAKSPEEERTEVVLRALVLPAQEERHFALVPMVADFLRRERPDAVAETGDRLEQRAYALIVENGYQNYDRFQHLDVAWPTVAPAIPLFLAGPNPRLQTVCDALQNFLEFTGRWDEKLSLYQRAEARAVAAEDLHSAGWRAFQAGWVCYLRGQADAVLDCADRAAAHWQGAKAGGRERAVAIGLRGLGHRLKQDYPAALRAYGEALELYRSVSAERADVALTLNDIATVEMASGDYPAAERHYGEALRVARAVGYDEGVAN